MLDLRGLLLKVLRHVRWSSGAEPEPVCVCVWVCTHIRVSLVSVSSLSPPLPSPLFCMAHSWYRRTSCPNNIWLYKSSPCSSPLFTHLLKQLTRTSILVSRQEERGSLDYVHEALHGLQLSPFSWVRKAWAVSTTFTKAALHKSMIPPLSSSHDILEWVWAQRQWTGPQTFPLWIWHLIGFSHLFISVSNQKFNFRVCLFKKKNLSLERWFIIHLHLLWLLIHLKLLPAW